MSNADVYERVTNQVIAALQEGAVPWQQPWSGGAMLPMSMSSGKPYRGVNIWLLGLTSLTKGYGNPWWGTYNQITGLGGQVRRGEKSTMAVLWKQAMTREDENGDRKQFLLARGFLVFNADQADWADGMPARFTPERGEEHNPIAEAEALVAGYPNAPTIRIIPTSQAYYSPKQDLVNVPQMGQYKDLTRYYATLFHELGHSTGHSSRLDREGVSNFDRFGSHLYSKEELIAEMTAVMCCAIVGIEPPISEASGYIDHWLTAIKGDTRLVMQAAAAAQKAVDHILGVKAQTEEVSA